MDISIEDVDDAMWNYIFFGPDHPSPPSKVSLEKLKIMRNEFMYWYPMDLRSSGKDLLANHLTYMFFNHMSIFGQEMMPKSVRLNGHMLLNKMKMSKSTGNFLTIDAAIKNFGADATRIALADAGDAVTDANFVDSVAKSSIAKLQKCAKFIIEVYGRNFKTLRSGIYSETQKCCLLQKMHLLIYITNKSNI